MTIEMENDMTKDEIQSEFTYTIVTVDNKKHVEMSLEEFDKISTALQSALSLQNGVPEKQNSLSDVGERQARSKAVLDAINALKKYANTTRATASNVIGEMKKNPMKIDREWVILTLEQQIRNSEFMLLLHGSGVEAITAIAADAPQVKAETVDLETLKRVHPIRDRANGVYSSASYEVDGYNRAIDEIKFKYGDLYTIERE